MSVTSARTACLWAVIQLLCSCWLARSVSALSCAESKFPCVYDGTLQCVERSWLCDDFADCDNEEDEDPAICAAGPQPVTESVSADVLDSFDIDADEEEVTPTEAPAPEETPEMCSRSVCETPGPFVYRELSTYVYHYVTEVSSRVVGTSEAEAKFTLDADVEVESLTACEMRLKFNRVELRTSRSDGGETTVTEHEFLDNLRLNTLRFSMSYGLVETLCPTKNETLESLNFKRGLLGLMQNSMPRFDLTHENRESDVLGQCDTRYEYAGTNVTSFYINKIKDLNSCSNEASISSSAKSIPYAFIGGLQSAPILESKSSCRQTIAEKIIKAVECTESHRLIPFSSNTGGVVTHVKQRLKHTYTSLQRTKRGSIARRERLQYEHFAPEVEPQPSTADSSSNEDSAHNTEASKNAKLDKVNTVLESIAVYLRETRSSVARPRDFSALVSALRHLTADQLVALAEQIERSKSWFVFQDAVSNVGTAHSVELMKRVLTSRPTSESAQEWMRSLAYISRPDAATIRAAMSLLDLPSVPGQALLGVGALVGAYCHHTPACQTHQAIRDVMEKMQSFIKDSCVKSTSPEKIRVMMAIKGIGNAGRAASETTVGLLRQCFAETENESEIRVAVVTSFRRFPCNLTKPLEDIMNSPEEDSEVRISAYLGVMRCADYNTLALVKNMLENEEVNQVGSFIWTHLSNIQESALPSRATIQGLLSNVILKEKFNTDARKFSRNYELSGFYDPLNMGASLEGNVIFSRRSYIPRSASLNFTTDLFGQSFNWFELEARVEGMERPLESFLMGGMPAPRPPEESIRDVNVRTLIDRTRAGPSYRTKEPELSVAVRTFGTEVVYQHVHGSQPILANLLKLDPREYIQRLNRGETLSLQKSSQPIESSGRVATSAGLPLTVSVQGTVALDVWTKATIEFGSFLPSSFDPRIDIRGTLMPSVSTELSASVTVDGVAAVAGVELQAALSSTTTLAGRIMGRGMSSFSLDVTVPQKNMEVVNMTTATDCALKQSGGSVRLADSHNWKKRPRSHLVLLHGSSPSADAEVVLDRQALESTGPSIPIQGNNCTAYADEIGAQVCWSGLYPNTSLVEGAPNFPLTGPAHLKLLIKKTDQELRTYQIRYNLVRQPEESSLVLSANTPGTSKDREHSVVLSVNSRQQTAAFKFHSPQKHFDAKGRYVWDDLVKRLDMVCQLEGAVAAEVELSLTSYEKSSKSFYKPTAKIKWRGTDLFSLEGDIEAQGKASSELYKLGLQFSVNTLESAAPSQVAGTIRGELSTTDHTRTDASLIIDYNIGHEPHNISVQYSMVNASSSSDWKFISNCKVVLSQFKTLNFVWNNAYRMKPGSVEMDVMLNFGEPYLDPDNAMHLHRSLTFLHTADHTVLNSTMALRHNRRNIDMKLSGDFSTDWGQVVNSGFIFQLVRDRELSARMHVQRSHNPMLEGSGSFKLRVPTWEEVQLQLSVNETSRRQYNLYLHGSAGAAYYAEAKGTYTTDPLQSRHLLLLAVRLPDRGITNLNATALLAWPDVSLILEVRPSDGSVYRGLGRYSDTVDQLKVNTRSLHLEMHRPEHVVKWTTDVAVGTVITITNRMQIGRFQDIVSWLILDIMKEKQRGVQLSIQWDPNRDPLKKVELSVKRDWSASSLSLFDVKAFLGLLSHTYQMKWSSTVSKLLLEDPASFVWEQKNLVSLVWEEGVTGQKQEVVGAASLRFARSDAADLTAALELNTPFHDWKENYLRLGYSRDHDHVKGSLKSRWHDHEFFSGELKIEKSYENLHEFSGTALLDISSSFRGVASLNTGAEIKRSSGLFESNAFIQWEEDRAEVRLEAYDQSSLGILDYSVFGQAITSLEGYRSLSGELNLHATALTVKGKAAARWDSLTYELQCRGNRLSGFDFLHGEVALVLPGYETDDFYGQFKIYEDPEDNKHKLLTIGKWGGKTIKVVGSVASSRRDFHGSLTIDTPFDAFPHASLVLGKGFDGVNHKSEARLAWGNEFSVGFVLKAHITSLSDFLVSAAVSTPFERFREVKAEIVNLFVIGSDVRCHSRIYSQVGDKRYGIGGRYEQGRKPRIRVAFEVYTPLPSLELLSLDLSDNSINRNSEYDLNVLYGSNSPLQLTVVVVRAVNGEDWAVVAALPFSVMNPDLHDVHLDVRTGLGWGDVRRVTLAGEMDTGRVRKLMFDLRLPEVEIGSLEASMGGFIAVPGYDEVALKATFRAPDYDNDTPGSLDASFRTNGAGTTAVSVKGHYRSVDAAFTSPLEPFRTGEVKWRVAALDVVRETVSASFKWEEGTVQLQGVAHIEQGLVSRLDAKLTTPWNSLSTAEVILDNNQVEGGGFTSHTALTGAGGVSYVVDVELQRSKRRGSTLHYTVASTADGEVSEYTGDLQWRYDAEKLLLGGNVTTPLPDLKIMSVTINMDHQGPDYSTLIGWTTPSGRSGTFDMQVTRDPATRSLRSSSSLTLQPKDGDPDTYGCTVNLENRSTNREVDLDLVVELTSSHDDWDRIKVEGTVRQVTSQPGEVRLSLSWPKLSPVTFRGTIAHRDGFANVHPAVEIEIENMVYAIEGELQREGDSLLKLRGLASMQQQGQPKTKIELTSDFNFPDDRVQGLINLKLPLDKPWNDNTANIEYLNNNGDHRFKLRLLTGGHESTIEGNVNSPTSGEVVGSITVASTLKWNKHPTTLTFKQSLTDLQYTGEYRLEFPRHNAATDTWSRAVVEASLKHQFLAAGHKGVLSVHPAFIVPEPIKLNYGFEFPTNQDMTLEIQISYKALAAGIKVEEVTVDLPNGEHKRRFAFELNNPVWPFGVANFQTASPDGNRETKIEIYDLMKRQRKITLVATSARQHQGRMFSIKTAIPGGRKLSLEAEYNFSSKKVELLFNVSWLENQHLDMGLKWEDMSHGEEKQHRLVARVSHPFRAVLLEADYSRKGATVDADVIFDWNTHRRREDVLLGKLQWRDLSDDRGQLYQGHLSLAHPALSQDIISKVQLQRNRNHPLLAGVTVQYSRDRARDLTLSVNVTRRKDQRKDSWSSVRREYFSKVVASHPHTNLHLEGLSNVVFGGGLYSYNHTFSYVNSNGHSLNSRLDVSLDLDTKILKTQMAGGDKELDMRLTVLEEGAGKWRIQAVTDPDQQPPLLSSVVQLHPHHPVVTIVVENLPQRPRTQQTYYDDDEEDIHRLDATKLIIHGGVEDMRNVIFALSHLQQTLPEEPEDQTHPPPQATLNEKVVSDVDLVFRLNHTRLITSRLLWRPSLRHELANELSEIVGLGREYRRDAQEWARELASRAGEELLLRARPIVIDVGAASKPLLAHYRNQSREFVLDLKKIYITMNLTEKELQHKTSIQFIVSKIAITVKETNAYKWLQQKLAGGTLRGKVMALLERLKAFYHKLASGSGQGLRERLRVLKTMLAETHDRLAKRWYLKLSQVLGDFRGRMRAWLRSRWHAVYYNYKPHILTTLNNAELAFSQMVATVSELVSSVKESFQNSIYYNYISYLSNNIKIFVGSVLKRPLKENLEKAFDWVEAMLWRGWQFFLTEVAPFLEDWVSAVLQAWDKLREFHLVQQLQHRAIAIVDALIWSVRHINFRERLINTVAFAVENGYVIATQTALDAEHRIRRTKTYLYLDPDEGRFEFFQKLPMEWYAFNQAPKWEGLKEWRHFTFVKSLVTGDRSINVLDYWYKHYSLRPDPASWLPPFQASSKVVGQQHLITWNGRLLEFRGQCKYLLAADLVSRLWAVVLNYHLNAPNGYIIHLDGRQIEMEHNFVVKLDGQPSKLPIVLRSAVVYRSGEELVLRQGTGLEIHWNQLWDVFSITVPGHYYGKVGGMLGLNNYEHVDDGLTPTGYLVQEGAHAVRDLAAAWSVSQGGCKADVNMAIGGESVEDGTEDEVCHGLFRGQESPFKYCFYQLSATAYLDLCHTSPASPSESDRLTASCATASAYRQSCSVVGVPTKIPHNCNVCRYEKADSSYGEIPESQTTVIPLEEIPKSTDVVIIMEGGPCNSARQVRKNLNKFYQAFDQELESSGLPMTRYAVITYGGRGFFAGPQQVLVNSDLFTTRTQLEAVLANIEFNTESTEADADAFEALRFASNLHFRAGVTPTFLMMPCTPCQPDVGALDFSTMYHILVDRGVVLHVITPAPFKVEKESLESKILGMDIHSVYTLNDAREGGLQGDTLLRRQVEEPRDALGYCSPLALQSNGTVFSSSFRRARRLQQLAVVLGRRVAVTAQPRYDQRCICLPTTDDSVRIKCHRQRPDWGSYSVMAPYFDEEEEDYLDTMNELGYNQD